MELPFVRGFFCNAKDDSLNFLVAQAGGENEEMAANAVNKSLGKFSCAYYTPADAIYTGEHTVIRDGLVFKLHSFVFLPERPENLSPALWPGEQAILFGAGVLFIGYEGFGLIANAAGDMRDPQRTLPRALYIAVLLVIVLYLAVSLTVTGNLSDAEIERAKDYALAEAAKPFLGDTGFRLIAIAALFSTASAINATLFGSANVCYMIARDGELPARLSCIEWKQATGGLLLTAALVMVVMLSFDLAGIAMMGSAAFLLVYGAVNAGHLLVLKQTGANALIVWLSLLTCLAMFAILGVYTYQQQPAAIAALVLIGAGSFAAEWLYRRWTGRKISALARRTI